MIENGKDGFEIAGLERWKRVEGKGQRKQEWKESCRKSGGKKVR
jgi:hypothetical protein